jgi:hypothetical protein
VEFGCHSSLFGQNIPIHGRCAITAAVDDERRVGSSHLGGIGDGAVLCHHINMSWPWPLFGSIAAHIHWESRAHQIHATME